METFCTSIEGFYCETLFKNDIKEPSQRKLQNNSMGLSTCCPGRSGYGSIVLSERDNNIISITTKPSALEDVRSINQLATIDQFNVIEYQDLYF